jgi:hypothetical protein
MCSFNNKFTEILRNYPDVTVNRKRFVALLRDYFPTKPKSTRLLTNLHELRLFEEIERADALNDKFAYRYIRQLVEEFGVDEQNAAWGVRAWCLCYGEGILGKPCSVNAVEDSFAYAVESDDDFASDGSQQVSGPSRGRILVPCALSAADSDCGYHICGIIETPRCSHEYANIYALVYNYITRSSCSCAEVSGRPTLIKDMKTLFQVDYSNVFRLETVVLQLIKNNYITDSRVGFRYDGDIAELRCALLVINNYAELFCRLVGVRPCPPLRISKEQKAITISFSGKQGVYIEANTAAGSRDSRELWLGQRINYKLTRANVKDLEYILAEIGFDRFRDGQFESLKKMLSSDEHTVSLMPPGKGKSLLFGLAALLQPLPVTVIEPSQSGMSDALKSDGGNGISYILLDENHCLANWQLPLSFEKIGNLAAGAITCETLANLENINAHLRLYSFGLLIFLAKLRLEPPGEEFDDARARKIVAATAKKDFLPLINAVAKVYELCGKEARFAIHKNLGEHLEAYGLPCQNLFDIIYLNCKKDFVYYGIMAKRLNPVFGGCNAY